MATDREILKLQQIGSLTTTDCTDARATVAAANSTTRSFLKTGTENAATNVAETLMFSVRNKSKPTVYFTTPTNVAADNTNYLIFKINKKTAGATSVLVASWNTHGGAQGAMTTHIPAAFVNVANADAIIAAGDTLHYLITKATATGELVDIGTIDVVLEAV